MDRTYWHKQTLDKPLYPDLLWSRPENKAFAGKLLVIGGNSQGFAAAAEAFSEAAAAGIGTARVLLPDVLQKTVGNFFFEVGEYTASTPSGSFGRKALPDLLDLSAWADGVLVAGDLGRNAETAILLEQFIDKYPGQLTFTRDAANYAINLPNSVLLREDTLLVLNFGQLQRLGNAAHFPRAFTREMGLLKLIDNLHELTKRYPVKIITRLQDTFIVADGTEITTTAIPDFPKLWCLKTASHASVWWLQNPGKPLAALTSAVYQLSQQ